MSEINRLIAEEWGDYRPVEGLVGLDPESSYRMPIPDYEHDLNAAIGLLTDLTWELHGLAPGLFTCDLWQSGHLKAHETAVKPALAVCKAWLRYKGATVPDSLWPS